MDSIEHTPSKEQMPQWAETGPLSTVGAILTGKSQIKYLSSHMETREVQFREYPGNVHSYELIVPHLTKAGEKWITEIGVWFPAAHVPEFNERVDRKPEMQIDILTGQGHMALTKNPETMRNIYEEIRRQTDQKEADTSS